MKRALLKAKTVIHVNGIPVWLESDVMVFGASADLVVPPSYDELKPPPEGCGLGV